MSREGSRELSHSIENTIKLSWMILRKFLCQISNVKCLTKIFKKNNR